MSVIISRPTTRRRRILHVGELEVLSLIFANRIHHEYVNVPIAEGLPEDVDVHGVYYDHHLSAFCFMLSHESFEEVEQGMEPPTIEVIWTHRRLATSLRNGWALECGAQANVGEIAVMCGDPLGHEGPHGWEGLKPSAIKNMAEASSHTVGDELVVAHAMRDGGES